MKTDFATRRWIAVLTAFLLFAVATPATAQYPNLKYYGQYIHRQIGGNSLLGGFDFNQDGKTDIAAGSVSGNTPTGLVQINGHDGTRVRTVFGSNAGDAFGASLAGPGDLNGDGYPDLLIGAIGETACPGGFCSGSNSNGHYVRAVSGSDGSTLFSVNGAIRTNFGGEGALASIGDVNGDGKSDFIVGAGFASRQTSCSCSVAKGEAYVYSGSNGSLIHTVIGANFGDSLGMVVGGVGDLNSDSVPDFAVAGYYRVNVYSGSNAALLFANTTGGSVGGKIFPLADVNSDGKQDFVVNGPGTVRLLSGANGNTIWTQTGLGANFGLDAAKVGDFNSDGIPDLIVGNPDRTSSPSSPVVNIVSGSSGSILYTFSGPTNTAFGNRVTALGDVNTDGVQDFAVAAPGEGSPAPFAGSVSVFYGPYGQPNPYATEDSCVYHRINGVLVCL